MCTRQLPIRPGRYRRLHARVPARSRASAARADRSPERGIRVPDGPSPHPKGPGAPLRASWGPLCNSRAMSRRRFPGNPATRRHASSAAALLHAANAFEARRSGWRCGPWDWTLRVLWLLEWLGWSADTVEELRTRQWGW